MGSPAKAPITKQRRNLFSEIWSEKREVVKALLTDVIGFVLFLLALLLGFLSLKLLSLAGYPQERITRLENLHYWAYVCAVGLFLLELLVTLFRSLFLKGKAEK